MQKVMQDDIMVQQWKLTKDAGHADGSSLCRTAFCLVHGTSEPQASLNEQSG